MGGEQKAKVELDCLLARKSISLADVQYPE